MEPAPSAAWAQLQPGGEALRQSIQSNSSKMAFIRRHLFSSIFQNHDSSVGYARKNKNFFPTAVSGCVLDVAAPLASDRRAWGMVSLGFFPGDIVPTSDRL
jgi:hypothetical protein